MNDKNESCSHCAGQKERARQAQIFPSGLGAKPADDSYDWPEKLQRQLFLAFQRNGHESGQDH
eukprot:342525-Amphidinium_carterae.1